MPNPTLTTPTYAGEFSGKYISAALLSATTLDAGLITIMPNAKQFYRQVLTMTSLQIQLVTLRQQVL